ncbi:unnamed protein product [Caenorhabditis nigoni]
MEDKIDYESDALKTKTFPNEIDEGEKNGVEWSLTVQKEEGSSVNAQKMSFEWKFKWEEPEENVIGLKGTLMIYLWNKDRYIWTGPYEFDIELIFNDLSITHSFELEPIYEKKVFLVVEGRQIEIDKKVSCPVCGKNFANTSRMNTHLYASHGVACVICKDGNYRSTKAIYKHMKKKVFLVVEGRNIEIDKKILSKNSTYFADLFNSDRTEFPIENVTYSEMKQLLRILDPEPQVPNVSRFPAILQLAKTFKIPSVRLFIEFYLMLYDEMPLKEKIEMADKFGMNNLLEQCFNAIKSIDEVKELVTNMELSEGVKAKLFDKCISLSK